MPTVLSDVRFQGYLGRHLLRLSSSQFDPSPTSPLRYPGKPHPFTDTLASDKKRRIVARCTGPVSANGEARIKRKSGLRRGARLVPRAKQCQRCGKRKVRHGIISVGLDAPAQPRCRFGVGAELQLSEACELHPTEGSGIAGRQAERLVDMSFGLTPPAQKVLGGADEPMCVG